MNQDKDQKATDDKQNDDKKTGDQATDNQTPDIAKQLIAALGGNNDEKSPTMKDEVAEIKMELATLRAEKVLSAQFPNAPQETITRLAQSAASLDGESVEAFTQDLRKLVEVNAEKKTGENLEFDAAGSTSKAGDASGQRTRQMGPASWGSSVDLAFVG